MTVKERTSQVLEDNRGKYVSGADIASELGVTRNAVWKAVNALKEEGYSISAVTNKGYILNEDSDILSERAVKRYLEKGFAADIKVYPKVTSTNTLLKELAEKGAPEGTIVIAAEQTAGKGRFTRRFVSKNKTGVYLSILLRPEISPEDSLLITTAAAVAVSKAVDELSGRECRIKWVNDVILDNRKICGILTEASFVPDGGGLEYAVLGIGVNVFEPKNGFPDEIKDTAGAALTRDLDISDPRSRVAAGIIGSFFEIYKDIDSRSFIDEYKRRSSVIGEDVYLYSGAFDIAEAEKVHVTDIDDRCRLIVRKSDGTEQTVSSGEISLKLTRHADSEQL